jgi:hypothetical protein
MQIKLRLKTIAELKKYSGRGYILVTPTPLFIAGKHSTEEAA